MTEGSSIGRWLRLLVSLGLLGALFLVVDVRHSLVLLGQSDPRLWPALLAVNTCAYLLFALRWGWFCRRIGLVFPFSRYLSGIYRFQLACQLLPSSLLGEAGRFGALPKGTPSSQVLKSIALDRLANQGSLFILVSLLLPYYWRLDLPAWCRPLLLLAPGLLVAVVLLVALLRRTASQQGWLRRRLGFLRLLLRDRQAMLPLGQGLVLSLVVSLEFLLAVAALRGSFDGGVQLLLLIPALTLTLTLMPISFADWGTRELVALAVLRPTGIEDEQIVAAALLVGLTNLVSSLPGIPLMVRKSASS